MKNILMLLILVSSNLLADFVTVSSQAINSDGTETTLLNNFSASFSNLVVSSTGTDTNNYYDIPIFVRTDTNDAIVMTLTDIGDVIHDNTVDTMGLSLSYNGTSIENGQSFNLLEANSGTRDGSSSVGNIRVTVPSVGVTQKVGDYSLTISMDLAGESTQNLPVTASVDLVAVAGFEDVSDKIGKNFISPSSSIDFGSINLNQKNTIPKDLFVRSNSNDDFTISFSTAKMIHEDDNSYKLNMKYYWNDVLFTDNKKFIALTEPNEGKTKVGTIKFETQIPTSTLIAGAYSATINVTITME